MEQIELCNSPNKYANELTHTSETGATEIPHMYGDLILTPEQEKLLFIDDGSDESEEQGIYKDRSDTLATSCNTMCYWLQSE